MVAPVRYPPFVSASRWSTLVDQLEDVIRKQRPAKLHVPASDGRGGVVLMDWPPITNGDVIKLTMGWLGALTPAQRRELFPFWYQFAAVAYAWGPKKGTLTATAKQRDALYPEQLAAEFWQAMTRIRIALDADNVLGARLDLDGEFSDKVFQGEVVAALRSDGVDASFKIPLPACKGKDGKPTAPKCKRYMTKWPYLCEEWEKCDPVIITDPITDIHNKSQKALLLVALIVAAWWAYDSKPRHRRK